MTENNPYAGLEPVTKNLSLEEQGELMQAELIEADFDRTMLNPEAQGSVPDSELAAEVLGEIYRTAESKGLDPKAAVAEVYRSGDQELMNRALAVHQAAVGRLQGKDSVAKAYTAGRIALSRNDVRELRRGMNVDLRAARPFLSRRQRRELARRMDPFGKL